MVFIYFDGYIYIYVPVRAHLSIFWLKNVKRMAPKAQSVRSGRAEPKKPGFPPNPPVPT